MFLVCKFNWCCSSRHRFDLFSVHAFPPECRLSLVDSAVCTYGGVHGGVVDSAACTVECTVECTVM